MVEEKKNERANALKKVKCLYKEFGFTAGMLAHGRKNEAQDFFVFGYYQFFYPKIDFGY